MTVGKEDLGSELKERYSDAIVKVSEGLAHDEGSRPAEATLCYNNALNLINAALQVTRPDYPEEIEEYIRRLNELRKQILVRIADIEADGRRIQNGDKSPDCRPVPESHVLAFTQSNVELFRILENGSVEKEEGSYELEVFTRQGENGDSFVRVGDWVYPVTPGVSLVWTNESGSYIFPAVDGSTIDGYVGVNFPPEADQSRPEFEKLLKELTAAQPVPSEEPKPVSESIASALEQGGQTVGTVAVRGAEFAGEWILRGGSWLRSQMSRTTEPVAVDPRLQTGISVARGVTGVAVRATEYLATQVGSATVAAGRFLAPHIREHGTNLLARVTGANPEEAAVRVDGALVVAGGAVSGVSCAYHGLETAGRVLAASIASSTVTIVQHRHGNQAAALTSNSLLTLLNLVETGKNVSALGVKGVAKKMAKSTGKAVVGQ